MDPKDRNAVVIRKFPNRMAAELAVSRLKAEDIEARILADDAGGAYPFLQVTRGVGVLVSARDEARAREILDAASGET